MFFGVGCGKKNLRYPSLVCKKTWVRRDEIRRYAYQLLMSTDELAVSIVELEETQKIWMKHKGSLQVNLMAISLTGVQEKNCRHR